ncbi:hypothetical protein IFM89_036222 [Coptis chinensis]|uniref:Uncharacterized protein n=1 Tax=Coptis chinensis TaxID=261450 RepID=A0A835M350_9MAGN|nr:hypothetical protein IFM89_036222 [Coptis chinensis]
MAGSFSFKPQFLLEKDQKVPLYASLFAEKLILGLSRTFTTTAILPKDRSVISKLSNLDHFNIVCDSIEKLKVAVVGQFKADVATSGIFRRENNTLKDFLVRERKHFGHLTNQLDAAEKAKKELWYALREKEEKLKKVEFDRDEKAEKLNKMEADYEEKLKLITEYEAEGNTLVAQMEFCVNVMKSFTPYLPQKLIDQYHLGSENEKEDAPEDSGNEVIEIVPPSDSVTKNHPFLRPKLWILIFDKRVLNLM